MGLTLVSALVAGGCGDDDDGPEAGGVTQTGTGIAQVTTDSGTFTFDDVTCMVADDGATVISAAGLGPNGEAVLAITIAAEPAAEDTFSPEDQSFDLSDGSGLHIVSDGTRMVLSEVADTPGRWTGSFNSDPEASTSAEGGGVVVNCP